MTGGSTRYAVNDVVALARDASMSASYTPALSKALVRIVRLSADIEPAPLPRDYLEMRRPIPRTSASGGLGRSMARAHPPRQTRSQHRSPGGYRRSKQRPALARDRRPAKERRRAI